MKLLEEHQKLDGIPKSRHRTSEDFEEWHGIGQESPIEESEGTDINYPINNRRRLLWIRSTGRVKVHG